MRNLKKPSRRSPHVPRARNAHGGQRQRLIDACISALHVYGPSRTTVEKVVAIAKMSPGIVRFYFASKAAMLVASLQFLAAEFEEQLLVPVTRLKSTPVAALELMIDLYLDPDIASARKVSVWYAFWGEASSRQEYYDICGQKDESFADLVRELIERLIVETSQPQLDPDGIALGLIGVLEMLWQDFAFRTEADIDRPAAKRRAMAYLRSIFPGQFPSSPNEASVVGGGRLSGWVYANARLFAIERETMFRNSWQFLAHQAQIPHPGNFFSVDLAVERVLLVRDTAGEVRAFRNSCSAAPHLLITAPAGQASSIECRVHGLVFALDGRRRGPRGAADLCSLDLRLLGDLILVRSGQHCRPQANVVDPWVDFSPPPGLRPLEPHRVASAPGAMIAADWKLVIEQWLEPAVAGGSRDHDSPAWSIRLYRHLLGSTEGLRWERRFIAPNHLIELRPDGYTILQVLPSGPGRSLLRRHDFTRCQADRPAHAARYVASRLSPFTRRSNIAVAESTQTGLVTFGHEATDTAEAAPAAAAFRRQLVALMPLLGLARAKHDF